MTRFVPVDDPTLPELSDYFRLTDVALRRQIETPLGLFMAESVEVIGRAVAAGYAPRSFLILPQWAEDVAPLAAGFDVPVYLAEEEVMAGIVGFPLHRGALAAMHRRPLPAASDVIRGARLVAVIEDVVDHTNVGAIFRSVAALGADAVLVTPACADPLYRRSVRVSMGTVFQVPWTRAEPWPETAATLHAAGFLVVGMGFGPSAVDIRAVPRDRPIAVVLGTERTGLSTTALRHVDLLATIPMRNGVDSLNVAAAAAVGLWELSR